MSGWLLVIFALFFSHPTVHIQQMDFDRYFMPFLLCFAQFSEVKLDNICSSIMRICRFYLHKQLLLFFFYFFFFFFVFSCCFFFIQARFFLDLFNDYFALDHLLPVATIYLLHISPRFEFEFCHLPLKSEWKKITSHQHCTCTRSSTIQVIYISFKRFLHKFASFFCVPVHRRN